MVKSEQQQTKKGRFNIMLIKTKFLIAGLLMVPVLALSAGFASTPVLAQGDFTIEGGVGSTKGEGVPEAIDGDDGFVTQAINIMLFIIGIISVVMIIFAGIKYATSAGAPDKVKSAKDTMLYSVVGLLIALLAYAIVNFVLKGIGVTQ